MDKKPNLRKIAADIVFDATQKADVELVLVDRDPRNPYAFVMKVEGQMFRVVVKAVADKDGD